MGGRELSGETAVIEKDDGDALARPLAELAGVLPSVVIGELIALTDDGFTAWVCHSAQRRPKALPALTTVELTGRHVGGQVVLAFEEADPGRPVVIGIVRTRAQAAAREALQACEIEIEVDDQRLMIAAKERLTLSCGDASLTLTQAGKVVIRGNYICTESAGVNRVVGGSVQLN